MEKLIKLLNEYENRDIELEEGEECNVRTENKGHLWFNGANTVQFDIWMFDSLAFSKEYGFIKWLVDNDKINLGEAKNGEIMLSRNDEENIIGRLSISDTPIDDLISYLK